MEPTDWIISSVIFVALVATLFVSLPWLLSGGTAPVSETEIKAVLGSVTKEIQVKPIILKSDCNFKRYDCNRYYPVVLDANLDYNYLFSSPFEQYQDKLYTVLLPQELQSVFIFSPGTIVPSYQTMFALEAAVLDDNTINITNHYMDANVTETSIVIKFLDSNLADLKLSYPRMKMSLLKNSERLIVVGNQDINFYAIFFPNTNEFWLYVPTGLQIKMNTSANNWRFGNNIGVLSHDAWWDYSPDDDYWWHYRLPITVNTLNCKLTNQVLQTRIDFASIKQKLNIDATLDPNSFRLIEYSNSQPQDYNPDTNEIDPVPFNMSYSSESQSGVLTWQMPGAVDSNTIKLYYLYFDFLPYRKDAPTYSSLSYTEPECRLLITIGDAQDSTTTQYAFISGDAYLFNPATIYVSVMNDAQRAWLSTQTSYRLPLSFSSGLFDRQDVNVSLDINFAKEFASVKCAGCDLNVDSVSLVEVSNLATANVIDTLERNTNWGISYDEVAKIAHLWFIVKGTTPAGTTRYYFLYYDNA